MKTYEISWDTCFIVVNLNDNESVEDFLKERDESFIDKGGKLCYDFSGTFADVYIKDVTGNHGVIMDGCFG